MGVTHSVEVVVDGHWHRGHWSFEYLDNQAYCKWLYSVLFYPVVVCSSFIIVRHFNGRKELNGFLLNPDGLITITAVRGFLKRYHGKLWTGTYLFTKVIKTATGESQSYS